ncbi:hypothetical protein BGZ65_007116 [Modicella reniformis]|uniref:F-box domain-containing protein n=1 Tax=Modicella reniformis TaxID=1440133 RepID=A0A9P6LXE2_9FUNG|nr:hypothetical protein BGZ65_007116 [Modicella reniformis]
MFDIPELDDMVCTQLSRGDLTQCARVNKTWSRIVVRYIWRHISNLTPLQKNILAGLIFHDHQTLHHHTPATADRNQVSCLSRYGPWVQHLDDTFTLLQLLTSYLNESQPRLVNPTPMDLLRHLLVHCSGLKSMHLRMYDDETARIVGDTLPQLQVLILSGSIKLPVVQDILSKCSAKLKTLVLQFQPLDYLLGREASESNAEELSGLQRLELKDCSRRHISTLSCFWKRCARVETVEITESDMVFFKHLVISIEAHMSSISVICINITSNLNDNHLASLLSASRVGWKSVEINSSVNLGELSLEVLIKHTSTLKCLRLPRCLEVEGALLKRILPSCDKLEAFVVLVEPQMLSMLDAIPTIDAQDFIDLETDSDSLTPWPCEDTLKVLSLEISADSHPFKGQSQIYKRLARFVNLEKLLMRCLFDEYETNGSTILYECLEMSLESGLSRLEGLKKIRVLSVGSLMKVGEREAQWMRDNWPKLREVRGLDKENKMQAQAGMWFLMNCPHMNAFAS